MFLAAAARLPGATHAAVTEAYESSGLVRSTSLRGTVHTSTGDAHAAMAAVAQQSLAAPLRRMLHLTDEQLAGYRAVVEWLTEGDWVDHDGLLAGVVDWLGAEGLTESIAMLDLPGPRYTLRGHPAMLRRPRSSSAGWDSQAEVVYRSARFELGEEACEPRRALVSLVRAHIAASGPVTRRDLGWWTGAGLRNVDAAIASLGAELVARPGPNGLDYLDLADSPARSRSDPGVLLLPEYDALLLGYDPAARDRFADAEAVAHSWNRANGVHSPTVLVDGRLRGRWRLERRPGEASIAVEMFPGERLKDPGDFTDQAAAVSAVLALPITDLTVTPL